VNTSLRRLLAWVRPHGAALCLAGLLLAIGALCEGSLIFLLETVLDDGLIQQDARVLAWVPVAVACLYGVKGVVRVGSGALVHRTGLRIVRRLRSTLFGHLLVLDPAFHAETSSDEHLSRLTQDVARTEGIVHGLAHGVEKPLTLLALLGAAFCMDWQLTLAALVVLPLVGLAIHLFSTRLRRTFRQSLDNLGRLGVSAGQSLDGVEVIQSLGGRAVREAHFDVENKEQERLLFRARLARIIPGPLIEALAAIGVGLVIYSGGARVLAGTLQPGELMAFLLAIGMMHMPLKGLSSMAADVQEALAGAERVFEILDRTPSIQGGTAVLPGGASALVFSDVWVTRGEQGVLKGVDLKVQPGEVVALVGASGCGKTTLASLVPRLLDPDRGVVSLHGRDLSEYTLESLRSQVAFVPQRPVLFAATVWENVGLGRPGATREQVEDACQQAGAEAFISRLPQGLDTFLEGAGARLSGGERQRLCIARALLLEAPVLILDEATSSMEPGSDAVFQKILASLSGTRTTLAIAHRLSTVRAADRIVVLEAGRIVDMGRHEDLLASSTSYRRFLGATAEVHS
jgi:subfamily B ATP-binding cassette protein MsbA